MSPYASDDDLENRLFAYVITAFVLCLASAAATFITSEPLLAVLLSVISLCAFVDYGFQWLNIYAHNKDATLLRTYIQTAPWGSFVSKSYTPTGQKNTYYHPNGARL